MNKWIATEYGETTDLKKSRSDYITVSSPLITSDDRTSTAAGRTKSFLPLIVYWKWHYELSGKLNAKVPLNIFTSAFTTYANSKGMKQKLDGAKLELTVSQIPVSFSFNDDQRMYGFIYYVVVEKVYFAPQKNELVVAYRLTKNNSEIKSGILNIPDANKIQNLRYWESAKKATHEYLSQYDENIKSMAKAAADKILGEL